MQFARRLSRLVSVLAAILCLIAAAGAYAADLGVNDPRINPLRNAWKTAFARYVDLAGSGSASEEALRQARDTLVAAEAAYRALLEQVDPDAAARETFSAPAPAGVTGSSVGAPLPAAASATGGASAGLARSTAADRRIGAASGAAGSAAKPAVAPKKKGLFAGIADFFVGAAKAVADTATAVYDDLFERAIDPTPAGTAPAGPPAGFLVMGHAGAPTREPDNTLEGMARALELGANALECDLAFTGDRRIVLLHDWDPTGLMAKARQAGLQGGFRYKPAVPKGALRRPVDELTLAELRANYHYALKSGLPLVGGKTIAPHVIPVFDDYAAFLAQHPEVALAYLDIKIPADRVALVPAFVDELVRVADANGILGRVVFATPVKPVLVAAIDHARANGYALQFCLDRELPARPVLRLDPADYAVVADAADLGIGFTSMGRPVGALTWVGGWRTFNRLALHNLDLIRAAHPDVRYIAWTFNDPLEIKWLLEAGVHGIMTDDASVVAKAFAAYESARR